MCWLSSFVHKIDQTIRLCFSSKFYVCIFNSGVFFPNVVFTDRSDRCFCFFSENFLFWNIISHSKISSTWNHLSLWYCHLFSIDSEVSMKNVWVSNRNQICTLIAEHKAWINKHWPSHTSKIMNSYAFKRVYYRKCDSAFSF